MRKSRSKSKDTKQSFRDVVAEAFIKSIEADPLNWRKEWSYAGTDRPYNAVKGNHYKGINVFYLSYVAHEKGYSDPRWATFNQASENEWRIKAGEKGTRIEYWMPIDNETGKVIAWAEYNRATAHGTRNLYYTDQNGKKQEKYSIRAKYFVVFNGDQIEGIQPLEQKLNYEIKKSDVVDRVSNGMNVPIIESNSARAYYSSSSDEIHIPLRQQFESDNAYQSTALHELGHATGHPNRLSRDQSGTFGTENYAFEELVAEIASTFMSEYFETEMSESEMKNHQAYVQDWADAIKKDKNYLFRAIKLAEEAADYMIEKGELDVLRDKAIENVKTETVAEKSRSRKAEEEFEM